ncbi:LytTR family transcriptional regulator [Bacteroidales bacterium OttesenSCG-928-C03]|nr:LytTR family transcriptional regulator [Bacteroidales bacterium OttesenSCG-928-C03]
MNKKIPAYLTEKGNIIKMLIFTAIFSIIFINIYKPFGSGYWKEVTQTEFFLLSVIVVVAGIGIIALSRLRMFHHARKENGISYWLYFTWIIVEIAIIALIYAFLVKFPFKLSQDFMNLFSSAFLYTLSILLFPYLTTWLYFALQDAERVIDTITKEENFVDLSGNKDQLIHFKDEKGTFKLSVTQKNILFLESMDNYVEINYLTKSKPKKFLLRTSLKQIEETLDPNSFVRCHRSYIINIENVNVLRKDKEGLFLEMDFESIPNIPVSKTYADKLLQIFSKD